MNGTDGNINFGLDGDMEAFKEFERLEGLLETAIDIHKVTWVSNYKLL